MVGPSPSPEPALQPTKSPATSWCSHPPSCCDGLVQVETLSLWTRGRINP